MQKHIYNILLLFLVQGLGCNALQAQVKVQVVSQKISKSVDWKQGMTFQLVAERADVFCTTHQLSTIAFEIVFIAKHENKSVAEADLKKMKWVFEVINKKAFLRNYIELARNESKPESDIKVVYHIKVPENCAVNIKNYFGKIEIENLNYKLNIDSEFSIINLQNVSGNTTISTTFGDISANGISGDIHIESNRSDIDIHNVAGNLDLHSNLAEIVLCEIDNNVGITIDAEKSKVKIRAGDYNRFSFNLNLTNVEMNKPDGMLLDFTKNEKESIKAGFNTSEDHSKIDVKLNIGTLTIEK